MGTFPTFPELIIVLAPCYVLGLILGYIYFITCVSTFDLGQLNFRKCADLDFWTLTFTNENLTLQHHVA